MVLLDVHDVVISSSLRLVRLKCAGQLIGAQPVWSRAKALVHHNPQQRSTRSSSPLLRRRIRGRFGVQNRFITVPDGKTKLTSRSR
jgi:hypothetical protein